MFAVREIVESDLLSLEDLYVTSIRANKEGFIQDLSRSKNIKDFVMDARREGGNFVGLFIDKNLVGFGGYINEGNGRLQICKLHLSKELQGTGYGKLIFSALEADAKYKGYNNFTLHVTNTQVNAINMYKKLGYVVEGEKDYSIEIDGKLCNYPTIYMRKKY